MNFTSNLMRIVDQIDEIRRDIEALVERSPDVASDQNKPAPRPTVIEHDHLPERTPKIVWVSIMHGYHWGREGSGPRCRSIPTGWSFDVTHGGDVILRHTFKQIMWPRDVWEKDEWAVEPETEDKIWEQLIVATGTQN